MKREWCSTEEEIVKEFSEDGLSILKLLWTMQGEKDPQKWHENIFGNKRCKHSQNIAEELGEASRFKDGEDVSLENLDQEAEVFSKVHHRRYAFPHRNISFVIVIVLPLCQLWRILESIS
ncbi:hypothetical protein ACSQ67_009872 [Phaseolus vulgaris]